MLNEKESKLDDAWFIGGGSQSFDYEVFDRNGEPLELAGCEITFTLSYIGQKETPAIIKDNIAIGGVKISGSTFTVEISPEDTLYLYDTRFEQQPIIKQPNGKVLRPSYGYIDIRKGVEI